MKIVKLGDVARIFNGNSINEKYKAENLMHLSDGKPYVATKDISYSYEIDYENGVRIPEELQKNFKLAPKGSVLLCAEGGSAGRKLAIIDRDVFFVNKLFCFEASEELNSKYLFYYLQAPAFQQLFKDSITGLIGGVSLEKVRNLPVELPSLSEQNTIVEKLDMLILEINKLHTIRFEKYSHVSHFFNSYRDLLLSDVCSGFNKVAFGDVGIFVRGPFGGSLKKSIFKTSGYAIYEQQHAIYNSFSEFRYFVDENKFQEMKRFEINENDLIMSCSGTFGKIAIVPKGSPKGIINQALLKISLSATNESRFIKHWMQSSLFQNELAKYVNGAALQNVPSVAIMKSIKIGLPPKNIQIEILEKLDTMETLVNKLMLIEDLTNKKILEFKKSILTSQLVHKMDVVA